RFGSLPQVSGVLYGIKPVVIALIVQAVMKLGKTALKSVWIGVVGLLAAVAALLKVDQLLVLASAGLVAGLAHWLRSPQAKNPGRVVGIFGGAIGISGLSTAASFSLTSLFLVFLKIGSVLFGGGYVLIALVRAELVARLHWITERQLLDAIAMGQATPGPLVPRLRQSPLAGAVLDGVNVAALALIAVVTWPLFVSAVVDWLTLAITAISLLLLFRFRTNSMWLVL